METARAAGTDTIVIENGLVIPDPGVGTLIEGGVVVIEDGRIAAVGDGRGDGPPVEGATRIDASGCAVMPGLISCHAHCRPFRGLGDGLGMMDWHHSFVHRFSEKMSSEDAYWGAANTFLEMLRNGITTVQVMTSITVVEDSEVAAARDSGIRARLIPHVASLPEIEATIARIEAERAAAGAADDRVLTWLGFEVPEVMESATMRVVADAAERLGVGVHTHFAEYEPGDVARLADAGLLRRGTSLAHCVWMSDDDIAAFAASGTSVSHNPRSNSRYGNGVARLRKLLDAGVVVGLGTDGPDSTFSCDVFEEARLAAFLARAVGRDPLALSAEAAMGLATTGGAAALGLEDRIGRLQPGMRADVIVVDLSSPSAAPVLTAEPHRNVAQVLLFGAVGKDVRDVVVDGRVVLRDRCFETLDPDKAVAETSSRAKRILAAM
jgi:5-methylthioadenosine/S-adenosylhomocysteine deaminase